VIYGSKIPPGVKLSIGYRQDPQDREISFTLIMAGAPLTATACPITGRIPTTGHPDSPSGTPLSGRPATVPAGPAA
jgi:hypothetical protein